VCVCVCVCVYVCVYIYSIHAWIIDYTQFIAVFAKACLWGLYLSRLIQNIFKFKFSCGPSSHYLLRNHIAIYPRRLCCCIHGCV